MALGISIQLHDADNAPLSSLTGITALWWDFDDIESEDFDAPLVKVSGLTTDSFGYLKLDLSEVSGLDIGDYGFVLLRKEDTIDDKDSLMFVGRYQTSDVTGAQPVTHPDPWVRTSDWLTMPSITSADEKFVGILAIHEYGPNLVALTAEGAYTVDWGDGTTEDFSTGVVAEHSYSYSAISAGTLSSRGYKQVVVTVTPQAGQTLSKFSIHEVHSSRSTVGTAAYAWLDIAISGPSLGQIKIGVNSYSGTGSTMVRLSNLERARILSSSLTTAASLFTQLRSLCTVEFNSSSAVTSHNGMFNGCASLVVGPRLDTSASTNLSSMYSGCSAMQRMYPVDTTSVTDMSSMLVGSSVSVIPALRLTGNCTSTFSSCTALRYAPLKLAPVSVSTLQQTFSSCYSLRKVGSINLSSCTTMLQAFNNCTSLVETPAFNTTSTLTSLANTFNNCPSLRSVALFDTSGVTTFSGTFLGCILLESVPDFNTSASTSFGSTFSGCHRLRIAPNWTTSAATAIGSMFQNCYSLIKVGNIGSSSVTSATSVFNGCHMLKEVGTVTLGSASSYTNFFLTCISLSKVTGNFKQTFSLSGSNIDAAEANALFTSLDTVSGKTIDISYTPASANGSTDRSIATAKGWTVSG